MKAPDKQDVPALKVKSSGIPEPDRLGEKTVIATPSVTLDESTSDMIHPDFAKQSMENTSGGPPDIIRIGSVGIVITVIAAILQHSWIQDHRDIAMTGIFVLGYLGIILEEILAFDKTGVALLMGVGIWTVLMTDSGGGEAAEQVKLLLSEQVSEISQILFFLIGAMTIVEIIDAHRGFKVVTDFITTNNKKILLWTIGILTFFVSAILDNLTSTIVVVSLLRKLVADPKDRLLYGAAVVISANAGGAWTPIGDVTTTQLWVHGNITALKTMTDLFLPSVMSMVTSLALFTPMIGEGEFSRPEGATGELAPRAQLVFWTGLAALVSVPIFKAVTGLPPYLGMLSGLGTLWVMTDALHAGENRDSLRGLAAVKRIDTSGVLFFLGILLAVAGLESAGILTTLAHYLDANVGSKELIATAIGLLSSIVDNVPLVAATMGMYPIDQIPQDEMLWQLIAYCAGTGGSILIIGSAAGVAFMYVYLFVEVDLTNGHSCTHYLLTPGSFHTAITSRFSCDARWGDNRGMEKVDFGWYARKASVPTLAGFFAGIGTYIALHSIHLPAIASTLGF